MSSKDALLSQIERMFTHNITIYPKFIFSSHKRFENSKIKRNEENTKYRQIDEKMATSTRYHRLPEESRTSLDSNENHDAQLLAASIHSSSHSGPKKISKLSICPTFHFRLLALILIIISFAFQIAGQRDSSIPATIFLSFALTRLLILEMTHIINYFFRIKIEIQHISPCGKSNSRLPKWLTGGLVQTIIDIILIITLSITAGTALGAEASHTDNYYFRYYRGDGKLVIVASILTFVACFLIFLSIPDRGHPSNITMTFSFGGDEGGETEEETVRSPQMGTYQEDVEAARRPAQEIAEPALL